MSLKSRVGEKSGSYSELISADKITAFCRAVGTQNEDQAPPTFLTLFRRGEFDLFKQLGIDLAQVLHAEQEYEYENPVLAGDEVLFETSLAHVLEKRGKSGSLQLLTFETEFKSQRGGDLVPLGKAKSTVVIRQSEHK